MNRSIGVGIHRVINPTSRKKNRAMFSLRRGGVPRKQKADAASQYRGVPRNLFMSTGRQSSAGGLPNAEA
jgi:hypothetical protein